MNNNNQHWIIAALYQFKTLDNLETRKQELLNFNSNFHDREVTELWKSRIVAMSFCEPRSWEL